MELSQHNHVEIMLFFFNCHFIHLKSSEKELYPVAFILRLLKLFWWTTEAAPQTLVGLSIPDEDPSGNYQH